MRRSPLHSLNSDLGARFVDFGGWEMPLQYDSVLSEHRAVRTGCGWFDVSHLGRFMLEGPGSLTALSALLTNDVSALPPGRTQYNLLLNDTGGIDDDLLVWRWGEDSFWVLPNAATHDEVLARFRGRAPQASITDLREATAMVAVQGPAAPEVLEKLLGDWPKRFATARSTTRDLWMAGTGYTGERGGELVGSPEVIEVLLSRLVAEGVVSCGLGARDTLRLEAGLLLAGQDFDATTDPFEVGLEGAISWDHDFVGRAALSKIREQGPGKRLAAFTLPGRKIPRHGYRLRADGSTGEVTSGNFSPMLECGIGLGFLQPPHTGSSIEVEIRGVWESASPTELPFYRR